MKLRNILVYVFCLMVAGLFSTAAAADRRVALVIGNSAYKSAPALPNTINDSTAIANLFKSVGFEVVISRTDLGVVDFKRAVREFLITAENSDVAVVYYAGHGVEIGGTNYLVPIDAKLSRDYDVEDEAVALDRIIWALQSVHRLRLILLDACRDNPFPQRVRSAGVRSTMKGGLGTMEDVSADTLVAYAAKAGSVSYDGDGRNSPYATALIRHLAEPGLDIRIALGRVRDDVIAMTGGRQEPFIYGSLGGATIALVPAAKKAEPPLAPVATAAPVPKPMPAAPLPQIPSAQVPAAPPPATVAKAEPPKTQPPSAARDTVDPALACIHDEKRLAQLRADPSRERITSFQKELSCLRLAAQVQRLLESVSSDPSPPQPQAAPAAGVPRAPPAQTQAQAQSAPPGDVCARDAARLARLREDPKPDAVAKFVRELGCEQIRPQLQRLRESLGM
ncbi:MAG: caspase family protein [Bradyrhizobium sp.]|uniref:caspase family protein n=1 Tax=Bradyrhizobium sp. TaxID=376 RepID=UPI001C286C38|nr:caspase family protein [Bradyrhizobium sp.]MBU6461518.1 caspase family protein [Pseudomonadota bacterium]MDE2066323.1 caspase family protein [Bradyrhizobium sp.]MDE2241126.1 caspase family protein [Bradyrhizobium sp.]MDE2472127.1 caspase family protein [Bradyrhizobium sp.]